MLPNSSTASSLKPRSIFCASSTRNVEHPADPGDALIVERMTRKRLGKMSPANAAAWKKKSMDAIMEATSENERESIEKYMNKPPSSCGGAGPSGTTSPATDDKPKKKKVKRTPDTPEGVTPSQRNGAPGYAILAYSPWV